MSTPSLARQQLAAAFRFFSKEGMDELVSNHFSYVPDPSKPNQFLTQPLGTHFSAVCASELLLIDTSRPAEDYTNDYGDIVEEAYKIKEKTYYADDEVDVKNSISELLPKIDPTCYWIHGSLHKILGPRRARCILHLHPHYATILCTMEREELEKVCQPIDQNTARWYNRLKFDTGFAGMGLGDEAERLAAFFNDSADENCHVLMMGNHGVLVIADSIGLAVDRMFYLERSCRTWVGAKQTGATLSVIPHDIAETTAKQWENQDPFAAVATMKGIMHVLDRENSDYNK